MQNVRHKLRIGLVGSCTALAIGLSGHAYAQSPENQWFSGELNQTSDNNTEYMIKLNTAGGCGVADCSTYLQTGDVLVGMLNFETNEDLTGAGGTNVYNSGDEFTAIFVNQAIDLFDIGLAPAAGIDFSFAPVTPGTIASAVGAGGMSGDLAGLIGGWSPGTMIALYGDSANDFTRVFNGSYPGPDDGDASLTGADIGVVGGDFKAEESLLKSAVDFTGGVIGPTAYSLLELGYTGAGGTAIGGEGWSGSFPSGSDLSLLRTIPPPTAVASFNAAINTITNNTGYTFDPVPCLGAGGIGLVEFCASGSILGVAGIQTPFDLFTNTDVAFRPNIVPAPGSLALLALGLLGAGATTSRRQRKAA